MELDIAEAEGGAAQVPKAAADRLGGNVRCAGAVEVAQDVGSALLQSLAQRADLVQGTPELTMVTSSLMRVRPTAA